MNLKSKNQKSKSEIKSNKSCPTTTYSTFSCYSSTCLINLGKENFMLSDSLNHMNQCIKTKQSKTMIKYTLQIMNKQTNSMHHILSSKKEPNNILNPMLPHNAFLQNNQEQLNICRQIDRQIERRKCVSGQGQQRKGKTVATPGEVPPLEINKQIIYQSQVQRVNATWTPHPANIVIPSDPRCSHALLLPL